MKITWNPPKLEEQNSEIAYTARHSIIVHEGATLTDGSDYPARPWIWTYIEENEADLPIVFLKNYSGDIKQAFIGFTYDVADEMNAALEDVRWSWPRETQTVARGTKSTPREISDTEELADSQEVRFV